MPHPQADLLKQMPFPEAGQKVVKCLTNDPETG